MDFYAYSAVKVFHVLAMALLFGSTLGVALDLRSTVHLGGVHLPALAARVAGRMRVTGIAGATTFLSGLLLVFMGTGFQHVQPRIVAGAALAVVLGGIGGGAMRKTWLPIEQGIQASNDGDALALSVGPLVRRFAALERVWLAIWLLIVVLMVAPIGV